MHLSVFATPLLSASRNLGLSVAQSFGSKARVAADPRSLQPSPGGGAPRPVGGELGLCNEDRRDSALALKSQRLRLSRTGTCQGRTSGPRH